MDFSGAGFSAPVIGVIHRREYPALCGLPLGGYGTGCLDLETSGSFGLCSIFNSHTPRRGAMNWPSPDPLLPNCNRYVPEALNFSTRSRSKSTTYTSPLFGSTATPKGSLN